MRKAIQIITITIKDGNQKLAALCDDGTIWVYQADGEWTKCFDIPSPPARN